MLTQLSLNGRVKVTENLIRSRVIRVGHNTNRNDCNEQNRVLNDIVPKQLIWVDIVQAEVASKNHKCNIVSDLDVKRRLHLIWLSVLGVEFHDYIVHSVDFVFEFFLGQDAIQILLVII